MKSNSNKLYNFRNIVIFTLLLFSLISKVFSQYIVNIDNSGTYWNDVTNTSIRNEFDYVAYFTSFPYENAGDNCEYSIEACEEDRGMKMWIRWVHCCGIELRLIGSKNPNSFYARYVLNHEKTDMFKLNVDLEAEYFKNKYPNGVAPLMKEIKINNHRLLYDIKKTEIVVENKFLYTSGVFNAFLFIEGEQGFHIIANLKECEKGTKDLDYILCGGLEWTFEELEKELFKHLGKLIITHNPSYLSAENILFSNENSSDPDIPWKILFVALGAGVVECFVAMLKKKAAAAATAGGAAAASTGSPPPLNQSNQQGNPQNNQQENKEKKEEEAHYILQINENNFTLKPNEPALLKIDVWRVTVSGKSQSSANIEILYSEKALNISNSRGNGSLTTQLTLRDKPQNPTFNIMVVASAEGKTMRQNISISTIGQKRIIIETEPEERSLRVIDKGPIQLLNVYAKVVDEEGNDLPEESEKLKFSPQSDWIRLSDETRMDGNYHLIAMAVGRKNNASAPNTVTLAAILDEVQQGEQVLRENLVVNVFDCELMIDNNRFNYLVTDKNIQDNVAIHIQNHPGDLPWKFNASYKRGNMDIEPLTGLEIIQQNDYSATLTIKDLLKLPAEEEHYMKGEILLTAQQENEAPLERRIEILVSNMGLFIMQGIDANNSISILADGNVEKEIWVYVNGWDASTQTIAQDKQRETEVKFEFLSTEQVLVNIESVLKPELINYKGGSWYKLKTASEIPGKGDIYTLQYKISVPVLEGEDPLLFEKIIDLKVQTYFPGMDDPNWEQACHNVEVILHKYVSPSTPNYHKIWEKYHRDKYTLGVEGLNELRRQIWGIGQNLILAEGAKGYENVDKWASGIVSTLEWAEWGGNIAFNALISVKAPYASAYASEIKRIILDAIKFFIYKRELGVGVFVREQLDALWESLKSQIRGRIISVKHIKTYLIENPKLAYALYYGLNFAYNLYSSNTLVDAIKKSALQISEDQITIFLVGELQKEADRAKIIIVDVNDQLSEVVKNIITGADGQEYIDEAKLLEYMRDPQISRTIKDHAKPILQKIYNQSKEKLYKKHDDKLIESFAKKYHYNSKDLIVEEVRTPGANPNSVNTDRDYRLMRKVKSENGTEYFMEVQTDSWKEMSQKIFGEVTNKPFTVSAKEWSDMHKLAQTDRFHHEASVDYSDHLYDNRAKEWVRTESNLQKVKRGEGTLLDPKGLGKMYENKVQAESVPSEKIAQTKKAVKTLKEVNECYVKRGGGKRLSKNLEEAMNIIEKTPTDIRANPEVLQSVNDALKKLNYDGVESVVRDVSKEIANLPPPPC